MIVVDASVLTDFLLGRDKTVLAVLEAVKGSEQEPLHAPELIEPETLNALRGLARGRSITESRANEAIADLGTVRMIRYPHVPLRERVWDLRHNLTAYDASYLALAEALPDALLMTADTGLADAAETSLGAAAVRHVG